MQALRGVDLALRKGEFAVLLDPAGSGESTLLNTLGGLDQPRSGAALSEGRDLAAMGERAPTRYRRDSVGFVFQFYLHPRRGGADRGVPQATVVTPRILAINPNTSVTMTDAVVAEARRRAPRDVTVEGVTGRSKSTCST